MSRSLVIVESPSKAKTINRYLGPDYVVEASLGHVRDLPKKDLAIDIEGGFQPTYVPIDRKSDVIERLRRLSTTCDRVYLATDPDREGEAIAWHIAQELGDDSLPMFRVLFNEITRAGVETGMKSPRPIDIDLVRAQEARRVMDRLIGYKISPFLWNAFRGESHTGLSAGRVQSVALRLVVEREKEINSFVPIEYWNLHGTFSVDGEEFDAKLIEYDGIGLRNPRGSAAEKKKPSGGDPHFIATEEEAARIRDRALFEEYTVASHQKKQARRRPPEPFTTSTLQQDANRRLRMKPKKAMSVAQKLYEGVDLGGGKGRVGLITYMRTDSTRLSLEAMQSAEEWIYDNFGKEYLPKRKSGSSTSKKEGVQDAHEAIRPTDLKITPKKARTILDAESAELYELIYRRFIASQMADALFDQTTVDIRGGTFLFRASGRVPTFRGWLQVYDDEPVERSSTGAAKGGAKGKKGKKGEGEEETDEDRILPTGLTKGKKVDLLTITLKQSATKPPPRFSESSLIRELEAKGIGRPSTYAATIGTILDRGYVREEARRLHATDLGIRVSDTLTSSFPSLFDVKFTARMEKDLDTIASGRTTYLKVMQGFYRPLSTALKKARLTPPAPSGREERKGPVKLRRSSAKAEKKRLADRSMGLVGAESVTCPKCSSAMELREGKYGPYYACTGFPKCSNLIPASEVSAGGSGSGTSAAVASASGAPVKGEGECPECGAPMIRRQGKNGEFLGCSGFPACRGTRPIPTDHPCPVCGQGNLVERRVKKTGASFWGCSRFPDCRYTTDALPET